MAKNSIIIDINQDKSESTMKDFNLRNAPITEAVIEIRVQPSKAISVKDLNSYSAQDYKDKKTIFQYEGKFDFGPEAKEPVSESTLIGYQFTHKSEKQVLKLRPNIFTFSRLAPYKDWNEFSSDAKNLWYSYCEIVNPKKVTRAALRYINRIDIPKIGIELSDYLRTYPELSTDLDQGIFYYLMRIHTAQEEVKGELVLNQGLVQPPNNKMTSILFDIDLYRTIDVEVENVWEILDLLRNQKNEVFQSSLTRRTMRLFD